MRSDVAMTGEITLRGRVLPIGGIKEKLAAAARAGLKRVLLPERNRTDLEDVAEETRKQLELVWLERVDDAMEAALEPRGARAPARARLTGRISSGQTQGAAAEMPARLCL